MITQQTGEHIAYCEICGESIEDDHLYISYNDGLAHENCADCMKEE